MNCNQTDLHSLGDQIEKTQAKERMNTCGLAFLLM